MLGCSSKIYIVLVQQVRLHSGQCWLVPIVFAFIRLVDCFFWVLHRGHVSCSAQEQWLAAASGNAKAQANALLSAGRPCSCQLSSRIKGTGTVDIASHGFV